MIEKWRKVVDKKGYIGAVLMDLSKAFDTVNHDLYQNYIHPVTVKMHLWSFWTPCLIENREWKSTILLLLEHNGQ